MPREFIYSDAESGRWIPPWLRYQRDTRYQWAAEFVAGQRVLEIGCGDGTGTMRLHQSGAMEMVGVDVEPSAIDRASRLAAETGPKFLQVGACGLPFDAHRFDVVVALETIEHVREHRELLQETTRVLTPGGCVLISTPNRGVTNPGTARSDPPANSLHVCEWTQAELARELEQYFGNVEWFGQTRHPAWFVRLLTRIGKFSPGLGVRVRQLSRLMRVPFDHRDAHTPQPWPQHGEPEVLLAICRRPLLSSSR
ncbi:MAG: class I SAM-dependent methyltransferase [Planctomycetaceae bacterium]